MHLPIDQFTKKEGLPSFCVFKTFILSFLCLYSPITIKEKEYMSKPKIEKKRKPMLNAIFGILANPRPKIPSSTIEMRTRSRK